MNAQLERAIRVRAVRESDIDQVLDLIRAKAAFDGDIKSLKATSESLHSAFFSDPPVAYGMVAILDGEVVGLATYYWIYSSFIARPGIWLDDLFVYPQGRGAGVGKALMHELCIVANRHGCGRIDWIVATQNRNGMDFYEHLGAKVSDDVRHARLDRSAILRVVANGLKTQREA